MLFPVALTLDIIKSRKHSVGNGGPPVVIRACMSVCLGQCDEHVACGHLNPGNMQWHSGSPGFWQRPEKDLKVSHLPLSY